MTDKELEQRLEKALSATAPDLSLIHIYSGGYPAHEGGFAAPRPAFQNVNGTGLIRGKQVGVQGVKTSGGVSPQEIFNMW